MKTTEITDVTNTTDSSLTNAEVVEPQPDATEEAATADIAGTPESTAAPTDTDAKTGIECSVDAYGTPLPDDSRIKRNGRWYAYSHGKLTPIEDSAVLDNLLLTVMDDGMPRNAKAKQYATRGFTGVLLDESLPR